MSRHLPDAETPDHQQAHFSQQRHGRRKQRPHRVYTIVDREIAAVRVAKAHGLALFLRKRLDHADAGNGIGQHIGHFGPDPIRFLEAMTQMIAHDMNHPRDDRQRQQRNQRKPRVNDEENGRRHQDHQHIGREIEQMQR